MFEKTSGSYNLIYEIAINGTAKKVIDCLSPADLTELNTYLKNNGRNQRHVIDGYVISSNIFMISHKVGGAEDQSIEDVPYSTPIYDWPEHIYIKSSNGEQTAIVRLILTHI